MLLWFIANGNALLHNYSLIGLETLFLLDVLLSDLSPAIEASARTGHDLDIAILAFLALQQLHDLLYVPKTVTFSHFHGHTLAGEIVLEKVVVLYWSYSHIICLQSFK